MIGLIRKIIQLMKNTDHIPSGIGNIIQWLGYNLWECYILMSMGLYEETEDKMLKVILTLKENGITEQMLCLEADIPDDVLIKLVSKFNT